MQRHGQISLQSQFQPEISCVRWRGASCWHNVAVAIVSIPRSGCFFSCIMNHFVQAHLDSRIELQGPRLNCQPIRSPRHSQLQRLDPKQRRPCTCTGIEYKGIENRSVSLIMGQVPRIKLTTSIIGSLIASPVSRITHARESMTPGYDLWREGKQRMVQPGQI